MKCTCRHTRADHSSDDYDLTEELGHCLVCACKSFEAGPAPCPASDAAVQIYSEATRLAMKSGQVTGEKSEYFITLVQLENILKSNSALEHRKDCDIYSDDIWTPRYCNCCGTI